LKSEVNRNVFDFSFQKSTSLLDFMDLLIIVLLNFEMFSKCLQFFVMFSELTFKLKFFQFWLSKIK
jgi:hypothetical protein